MTREIFFVDPKLGTYYIERHFALFPRYGQGTLIWLQWYYATYLDDSYQPITIYPYDPRKKGATPP